MAIQKLNEKQVAITVGLTAAIIHAVWAAIVKMGSGQMLIDWFKGIHFLSDSVTVTPFDIYTTIVLVIATFIIWALIGWLFAAIWNWTTTQKWAK